MIKLLERAAKFLGGGFGVSYDKCQDTLDKGEYNIFIKGKILTFYPHEEEGIHWQRKMLKDMTPNTFWEFKRLMMKEYTKCNPNDYYNFDHYLVTAPAETSFTCIMESI